MNTNSPPGILTETPREPAGPHWLFRAPSAKGPLGWDPQWNHSPTCGRTAAEHRHAPHSQAGES